MLLKNLIRDIPKDKKNIIVSGISTDSKKIAKIAEYYGAEVPFLRSKKLSDDFSTSKEVVIDAIKKIFSENEAPKR